MTTPITGAAGDLARHTIQLAVPLTDTAGGVITTLDLRQPTLGDRAKVQRDAGATSEMKQGLAMVSALSGVPAETLQRIKIRDMMKVQSWIKAVTALSDLPADFVSPADAAGEASRTFVLSMPIRTAGADLTELTLREPDLDSGIAVERFTSPAEQSAALIAHLSGQIIPTVMRLSLRDANEIDRYLGFFFDPGVLSPRVAEAPMPGPAMSATAGAESPSSSPSA